MNIIMSFIMPRIRTTFSVFVVTTMIALCTYSEAQAIQLIDATKKTEYAVLSDILDVRKVSFSKNGPTVLIFEIGGGDPAKNGHFIFITLQLDDATYTWETGININRVEKVEAASKDRVIITVKEDFLNSINLVESKRSRFLITFNTVNQALQRQISVEKVD